MELQNKNDTSLLNCYYSTASRLYIESCLFTGLIIVALYRPPNCNHYLFIDQFSLLLLL